jgi:hypothetical protein
MMREEELESGVPTLVFRMRGSMQVSLIEYPRDQAKALRLRFPQEHLSNWIGELHSQATRGG